MKKTRCTLSAAVFGVCCWMMVGGPVHAAGPSGDTGDLGGKSRAVILTDICNEPDDEQSLVRLLVYSDGIDIEGLVAGTSCWLREKPREDVIRQTLAAYGQVSGNLLLHAPGFPVAGALEAVTCTGQISYGMTNVGDGKSTDGSRRILAAADRDDPRPLWVCVWGGANTLAQALWDARRDRSNEDLARLVAKLRVYAISDQDDAGYWLREQFPKLFYVVSPSNPDGADYHRSTWAGISGDRHSKNGPFHHFDLVDNPWLEENIMKNHGPLGARYPRIAFNMEGDTPSWLGLIRNGLAAHLSPSFGGWGGRYVIYQPRGETRPIWTNNRDSRDTVVTPDGKSHTSDAATIWRWREAYQHDFAARMDWCVLPFQEANHNPVSVLNGDETKDVLHLVARTGDTIHLSAKGGRDPDGNRISSRWWIYHEAGTFRGGTELSASEGDDASLHISSGTGTLHVILEVVDDGSPRLFSYRRAIIEVTK